jgi:carboxyl-terminal processing protease
LRERYNHGELFTADSIKFDPGLQYTTKAGRTVYGGGGIMPDVFVPLDTTQDTRLLNQLYEFNIIRAYALSYYEDHQQALSTQTYSAYYEGFVVNEKMHQALQKMALDAGIKIDAGEYRQSQTLIAQHLKAWIARSVWKEEGFFPIWLERDEIFKKALTLFEEAARIGQ